MFRKIIVSAFQKKQELSSRMVSVLTKYTFKAVNRLVWYTYIKTKTSVWKFVPFAHMNIFISFINSS